MLETTMTGHVGTVRYVAAPGKSPVLNLSLAANRKVGDQEYTDWVSAKIWGERAGKLKDHVTKGTRLLIKGRPEARAYKKGDGTPGAELILHVNDLEFLSAKGGSHAEEPAAHLAEAELPLATA
jgi:single-strand DNA-binding protein